MHTLATWAMSESESPTVFAAETLGGADEELSASLPIVRMPDIISYNRLYRHNS